VSGNLGIVLEMLKPDTEIHEIQSLNREEIVIHKLHDALRACEYLLSMNHEPSVETWVLVEDTSLCISKLGGFPGPFIKFFLESMSLDRIGHDYWGAEAQSYVNLAIGRLMQNEHMQHGISFIKTFNGMVNGHIVDARGTHGFGFDPIFRPISSDKTNAEMSQEEKAGFNPRILAFQKVLEYLV